MEIARPGGAVGRVGAPQEETVPAGLPFWKNVAVGGGPAPARAYIEELMADVLDETIEPGRVFDRVTDLDGVPDATRMSIARKYTTSRTSIQTRFESS
jgi:threonine dehydrogenase-like Zn-dependent dehydrogenase